MSTLNNPSAAQVFSLQVRQNEIFKRVRDGGLSIDDALLGAQGILDGLYPPKHGNFCQFSYFLNSLEKQAVELRRLNEMMPNGLKMPDWRFDELETIESDHFQRIDDLEFFFIVTGSLEETLEYNLELIRLTQPGFNYLEFDTSEKSMSLIHNDSELLHYGNPGIYRQRINLVDNWDQRKGLTATQVRQRAIINNKILAGLPAIGALAAQDPKLCQLMDGISLPFINLADIQQGPNFTRIPYLQRDPIGGVIHVHTCYAEDSYCQHSVPTLIK